VVIYISRYVYPAQKADSGIDDFPNTIDGYSTIPTYTLLFHIENNIHASKIKNNQAFQHFSIFSLSAFQPFSFSAFQLFSLSAFSAFQHFQPFSISAFSPVFPKAI